MTLHWSRRTGLATYPSRRSASLLPAVTEEKEVEEKEEEEEEEEVEEMGAE